MLSVLAKAATLEFAAIFQTLPGMYLLLAPDLTVLSATEGFRNCLSQNRKEVTGKTLAELFPDQSAASQKFVKDLSQLIASARATGEPAGIEQSVNLATEASVPAYVDQYWKFTCIPLNGEGGELNCIVQFELDNSDEKAVLECSDDAEEQFKFLADCIPQLVWTTDPKGYHEYFNQRWTDYTGYTLEESRGPDMWNNLLHPDDRVLAREVWNESLKTGDPYEIEYRFKSAADGQYYWFLGRALAMRDASGKITKWFGTCTDISRKKQIEEELKEKNAELKLINDDLDSFVYMASHDLKLPIINVSTLFEELLQNVQFRDSEAEVMVGMIRKSLAQVTETINDLGEIVKVQKNIFSQLEEVNLRQVLNEVTLTLSDLITYTKANVIADFSAADTLYFSRVNLKSVVSNLVSNAVKFHSPNRQPYVTLRTWPDAGGTWLEVADNGLGLDLDKHGDKIFQMFKRFHNHVQGSGLGLHIISRIMHKSGGHISVKSTPDQGTTFSLFFPNNPAENV